MSTTVASGKSQERLLNIIRAPHISEKAAMATELANQYVIKVAVDATKPEIKAAVESLWNVSVEKVQVVNQKGKVRRTKNGFGRRSDWKKAYVSLVDGQQIDFTAAI